MLLYKAYLPAKLEECQEIRAEWQNLQLHASTDFLEQRFKILRLVTWETYISRSTDRWPL